ncbi:hypothetical protein [uncultured Erythrobacter sp.]|uniref:hypothetical protein n=1 Tax=uncultured Erythrobacter sp. TaxID=263913 RepID=UPI0026592047|nr:hypothetical protein [uncultured Erythrobacter sp.]
MPSMITIPLPEVQNFSAGFQKELLEYVTRSFAITDDNRVSDDAANATSLSVTQARAYLNNCSDATVEILKAIVDSEGGLLMSDISKLTGKSSMQLRGALGGITKRTRTICGDPQASLIEWAKTSSGDWIGRVTTTTAASFRVALAERT